MNTMNQANFQADQFHGVLEKIGEIVEKPKVNTTFIVVNLNYIRKYVQISIAHILALKCRIRLRLFRKVRS